MSKEEIDRNLEQQNGNKISFKSRGMSDNSLKYLLEVLKDRQQLEIDLSYNALTDRVIDILKQYAISNHFEYLLDHNSFTQTPQFSQPQQQQPQIQPQFQILLGPSNT